MDLNDEFFFSNLEKKVVGRKNKVGRKNIKWCSKLMAWWLTFTVR